MTISCRRREQNRLYSFQGNRGMTGENKTTTAHRDPSGPARFRMSIETEQRVSSGGVEKFVAVDLCGDAGASVLCRFDPHNLAVTSNIDVPRAGDLLGKGDDEFDRAAKLECSFAKEIQTAIADIARLRREFRRVRILRQQTHRQGHVEATRLAAVSSVGHGAPGRKEKLKNRNTRIQELQSKIVGI